MVIGIEGPGKNKRGFSKAPKFFIAYVSMEKVT